MLIKNMYCDSLCTDSCVQVGGLFLQRLDRCGQSPSRHCDRGHSIFVYAGLMKEFLQCPCRIFITSSSVLHLGLFGVPVLVNSIFNV